MFETLVPLAIFLCLVAAGLGSLAVSKRLHPRYRDDDTSNVVRLAANIFVVMTSLVLGLLINSAKNAFEAVDRNVHSFATELVLLDRSLRRQGPDSDEVRQRLAAYTRQAIEGTWPARGAPRLEDRTAEELLDRVGSALVAMRSSDPARVELWREAELNYQNVTRRRWMLIEESEGSIPTPFLIVVVAWLVLIFASFGYRAPHNAVVGTTLVVSAFLIAAAIYLILDMDLPFSGPIQISPAPLQRAAEQMSR
jgi:hypothetical protein